MVQHSGQHKGSPGIARAALLAAATCLALAAGACTRPPKPADPGLAADNLGIGVSIAMDAGAARDAIGSHGDVKLLVITPDELVRRNPAAEKPVDGDLVIALYNEYPVDGSAAGDGLLYGRINELRCFLGTTEYSRVTLFGHPVAGLNPAGMEQIFGHADELVVSSDGVAHLRYEFAYDAGDDQDLAGLVIRLVTSHNPSGNCFAMKLSLMPEL